MKECEIWDSQTAYAGVFRRIGGTHYCVEQWRGIGLAHSYRAHLLPHRCFTESAARTRFMTVTLGLWPQDWGVTKPLPLTITAQQDLAAKMQLFPQKNFQEQFSNNALTSPSERETESVKNWWGETGYQSAILYGIHSEINWDPLNPLRACGKPPWASGMGRKATKIGWANSSSSWPAVALIK